MFLLYLSPFLSFFIITYPSVIFYLSLYLSLSFLLISLFLTHSTSASEGRAASVWVFSDGADLRAREACSAVTGRPIGTLSEAELGARIQHLIQSYRARIRGGFSINCFGFGAHNDAFILSKFAEYGHGTYYCVQATEHKQQQQEFLRCFADCLHRKLTLVAQDVTVSLNVCSFFIILCCNLFVLSLPITFYLFLFLFRSLLSPGVFFVRLVL